MPFLLLLLLLLLVDDDEGGGRMKRKTEAFVDPWGVTDAEYTTLEVNLFAASLFPYLFFSLLSWETRDRVSEASFVRVQVFTRVCLCDDTGWDLCQGALLGYFSKRGLVARRCGEFDDYELVDRAGDARRFERCRERGEGETKKI